MATPIDRLLSTDYLNGIDGLPMTELRERRQACQEVETSLSYFRRLIQGRLDIVHAEISRRESGGEPSDLGDLIERLPSILAEHTGTSATSATAGAAAAADGGAGSVSGRGPLPEVIAPADVGELAEQLDAVVDADCLGSLPSRTDEEVRALADQLTDLERTVSAQRRGLHERIDALQDEIVRRYKSGEATVDALLG
ncbi:MAG TPA: hypothetical protein VNY84_09630 [Acidimicrobiales bacterium]|nr:hypothetical protein [Acidimicrobiales bacterium]